MTIDQAFLLLGLSQGCTLAELKARWRQLASKYHPDHGGEAAKFHELRRAYETCCTYLKKPKVCHMCEGRKVVGRARGFYRVEVPCATCKGRGVIHDS